MTKMITVSPIPITPNSVCRAMVTVAAESVTSVPMIVSSTG